MKFICNKCGHNIISIKLYKNDDENGKSYLTKMELYCSNCKDIVKKEK